MIKNDWLWDKDLSIQEVKKIFSNPDNPKFVIVAALLLSRKNSAKEVFGGYLKRKVFFLNWNRIKKQMRKNSWNDPRIEYWQAIYEALGKNTSYSKLRQAEPQSPVSGLCKDIGEKIREARKKTNLTQGDLAKRLKVSQQIISRIESGRQNISLQTLSNISKKLGFSLNIELK